MARLSSQAAGAVLLCVCVRTRVNTQICKRTYVWPRRPRRLCLRHTPRSTACAPSTGRRGSAADRSSLAPPIPPFASSHHPSHTPGGSPVESYHCCTCPPDGREPVRHGGQGEGGRGGRGAAASGDSGAADETREPAGELGTLSSRNEMPPPRIYTGQNLSLPEGAKGLLFRKVQASLSASPPATRASTLAMSGCSSLTMPSAARAAAHPLALQHAKHDNDGNSAACIGGWGVGAGRNGRARGRRAVH